jgi:hypothetical protein
MIWQEQVSNMSLDAQPNLLAKHLRGGHTFVNPILSFLSLSRVVRPSQAVFAPNTDGKTDGKP